MIRRILIAILVLACLFGALAGFTLLSGESLPKNHPGAYTPVAGEKTAVFAGDSITHGKVSADYVGMTREQASTDGWNIVNAGVNADLSYNLLGRFEDIVHCLPDYVFILIGTNDVTGSYSEDLSERAVKRQDLPYKPSIEWFRQNLTALVTILKEQTDAQIALYTIPPIGEDLNHPMNESVREFNTVIREIAADSGATVLPLYEEIARAIAENAPPGFKPKNPEKFVSMVTRTAFSHAVLRRSFDRIGEKNGYLYHSDALHLDEDGARFASNLAARVLSGENPTEPGVF